MNAHSIQKGSLIAKSGFKTEQLVCSKFNNWKKDKDALVWLNIMGYSKCKISTLSTNIIHGHKSDICINIQIKSNKNIFKENIQVKLVSNLKGFNQIDKRWLVTYKKMWNIPDSIFRLLQHYTGEIPPYKNTKNPCRMFLNEFSQKEQSKIITWFSKNKLKILKDIIKGRGPYSADWVLVLNKSSNQNLWTLIDIDTTLKYYSKGKVIITPRGSLHIGKVTMQRKGGDHGRNTSNQLQFKIDPSELSYI